MIENRRISTTRWWNKKQIWRVIFFLSLILFLRLSKSTIFRDFYYLISKPFWPGQYQNEVLRDSYTKGLNIKLIQLQKDNTRLRKLLKLQRVAEEDKISAAVISRQTGSWWQQIILNKGQKDGVEVGDAVVGPGGLIGIVQNTSIITASVKLLTSSESKVGVWNQRSNVHGLLVGVGNNKPKLIFYSKDLDVKEGDFVLSSPASTLLPPNIPVGIIEKLDQESQTRLTAVVQLIAKPEAIDWVQVLKVKF